jgi:hypothetical protein
MTLDIYARAISATTPPILWHPIQHPCLFFSLA